MMAKIEEVSDHLFQTEAGKISSVFESNLVDIYRLGGMNLPGIIAKPIVEIGVELQAIDDLVDVDLLSEKPTDTLVLDKFTRQMISLGYTPRGHQGIPTRRFFTKASDPAATFHLHVYQFGCPPPVYQHNFASSPMLMVWMGN